MINGRTTTSLALRYGQHPPAWQKVFTMPDHTKKHQKYQMNSNGLLDFHFEHKGLFFYSGFHLYGILLDRQSQVNYFFGEAFDRQEGDFVSQFLKDFQQRHLGIEWSNSVRLSTELKSYFVMALGVFQYSKTLNFWFLLRCLIMSCILLGRLN